MTELPPIRIGVLGAARIVPLAIAEPARRRPDVRLTAIAAREPARADEIAAQEGFACAAASYADLLARDDVDLVYIALPPSLHCEWAVAAARHGKAVLCEKPFAANAAEARAMVDAAAAAGTLLLEGYHYRFHRLIREAERLLRAGAIGDPVSARARVEYPIPRKAGEPRWDSALGGGALMDLGCYGVHALRLLLGSEPEVIAAQARMVLEGVDAATTAHLRFGQVEAEFGCAMDCAAPATTLHITGTRGTLEIEGFVLAARSGKLRVVRGGEAEVIDISGPSSYEEQMDHVVSVMRGQARPVTGGTDAIATMEAIDAIRRISRNGV